MEFFVMRLLTPSGDVSEIPSTPLFWIVLLENVTPETFERAAPLPELPENWLPVMLVLLNVLPESPSALGRAAVPVASVPNLLPEMFAPLSLEMLSPVVFPEITLFVMGDPVGAPPQLMPVV